MKKFLVIFLGLIMLSGCYNVPDKLKPMPWIFDMMPKDAPNNFKRGWIDGCESGLANMTNSFYRKFYSFRQDVKLRENATYYKAWKDTYTFCRHYAYGTLRETNQRTRLPNNLTIAQEQFLGAEGILDKGLLQMWGPVDALVPLNKVGTVGGDRYLSTGQTEREVVGGVSTLDYSGETAFFGFENGMNMDYSNIPFFGESDIGK